MRWMLLEVSHDTTMSIYITCLVIDVSENAPRQVRYGPHSLTDRPQTSHSLVRQASRFEDIGASSWFLEGAEEGADVTETTRDPLAR
jgi:hypothetical protein